MSNQFRLPSIAVFLTAAVLLWFAIYSDWVDLLRSAGFPGDKLDHPWIRGDLAAFRILCIMVAVLPMAYRSILWKYPSVIIDFSNGLEALIATRILQLSMPLLLTTVVLAKTVLQLVLYLIGYSVYTGDDFGRPLKADYWVHHLNFDLGSESWLNLGESGWLPFPDYLFGFALALHRDLFITPKIVNLILSGVAVLVVYLLGRELFGRTAAFLTSIIFAFHPWHVWLGISGMTSDLPSIVTIALFALFLFRWLETDKPGALLGAAGCLLAANGFRYENWFFSATFSLLVVCITVSRWRQGYLTGKFATLALCALVLTNAFPVIWMVASHYVLGNWLPALQNPHVTRATGLPTINIAILAFSSFPFEIALSLGGVALLLRSQKRRSLNVYLIVFAATLLLLVSVFGGRLLMVGGVSRILLPHIVILLPFAGFLLDYLLRASGTKQIQYVVAGFLLLLITGTFDILRAFNYPAWYPKEPIYAGLMVRSLQETKSIPGSGQILIEHDEEYWAHAAIAALTNTPERFVLLDAVLNQFCTEGFRAHRCRNALSERQFALLILSSEERASSFRELFQGRFWRIGKHYIFDMNSFPD